MFRKLLTALFVGLLKVICKALSNVDIADEEETFNGAFQDSLRIPGNRRSFAILLVPVCGRGGGGSIWPLEGQKQGQ